MAKLDIAAGSTSQSLYVFIQNSSVTTGAGLTGLTNASAGLVASYVRPLAARAAITLAAQTPTGAWTSGGFAEVDATNMPGVYRLDAPDAVFAAGVRSAVVMLQGATNMAPMVLEVELTADNNQVSKFVRQNLVGTGSTTTAIVLDAGASANADEYTNQILLVAGQAARIITAYNGTTKTATVAAISSTPAAGTAYTVIPLDLSSLTATDVANAVLGAALSGYTTAGTLGAVTTLMRQILQNRRETNPSTGIQTIYADDGVTALITGHLWNDVGGTVAYNGSNTINRADELA